jgi:hypothetical protein
MQILRTSMLVTLLLAAHASADVIVVSKSGAPGTLPTVQAGVDAAADGDTVLVQGLGAPMFNEDVVVAARAITLIADDGPAPRLRSLVLRDLPAGGQLVVRGLRVDLAPSGTAVIAIRVLDCAGSVRLEGLVAQGSHGTSGSVALLTPSVNAAPGMTIAGCADVALHACTLTGGGGTSLEDEDVQFNPTSGASGVIVTASNVSAHDCTLKGLGGGSVFDTVTDSGGAGGDGLRNVNGTVFVSGGIASGGAGGHGDCDVFAGICGAGGKGGNGIRQDLPGAALFVRDVTASGSPGGNSSAPGGDGQDGLPVRITAGGFTRFEEPARQFSASSPVREGGTASLVTSGQAGDFAFLLVGGHLGQAIAPPWQGAFLVVPPYSAPAILLGSTGGTLTTLLTAPELPAGLQAVTFHMQSVFQPSGASSPTLIGPWATVTVLDSAF